jgi:UDP-N-acetylglucosamine--N-acetylmuramyl-(pentapeptide) pyrophosphoryl-undecaprenol N-acetylglucosamine transferase
LTLINVKGLTRAGVWGSVVFSSLLMCSVIKSIYLILRFKPNVVIGTGGYVMGPVVMAAIALNKNRVIQEQNAYPGLTTRQLADRVDRVFLGFHAAVKHLKGTCTIIESGNPVKDIIGKISREEGRKYFGFNNTDNVIFIFGGSQGAKRINDNILKHLSNLPENYQLIWQTGEASYDDVAEAAKNKVTGRALFAFTNEIEYAYAAANIAIARAGALTLAELEAAGLPSILIPYPYAAADHQRKNAEYFVEQDAALLIDDAQLESDIDLISEAANIMESDKYVKMYDAIIVMNQRREKSAADIIADEIMKLTGFKEDVN